jgi:hypothetical protein
MKVRKKASTSPPASIPQRDSPGSSQKPVSSLKSLPSFQLRVLRLLYEFAESRGLLAKTKRKDSVRGPPDGEEEG